MRFGIYSQISTSATAEEVTATKVALKETERQCREWLNYVLPGLNPDVHAFVVMSDAVIRRMKYGGDYGARMVTEFHDSLDDDWRPDKAITHANARAPTSAGYAVRGGKYGYVYKQRADGYWTGSRTIIHELGHLIKLGHAGVLKDDRYESTRDMTSVMSYDQNNKLDTEGLTPLERKLVGVPMVIARGAGEWTLVPADWPVECLEAGEHNAIEVNRHLIAIRAVGGPFQRPESTAAHLYIYNQYKGADGKTQQVWLKPRLLVGESATFDGFSVSHEGYSSEDGAAKVRITMEG